MKPAKGRGMKKTGKWGTGLQSRMRRVAQGAGNALKMMREGRTSVPYEAPYQIALTSGILKLRHYGPSSDETHTSPSLLLIPPLMVTSAIYDISPELSAVSYLTSQGIDVWLADFGAPEEEDGWDRTLDDHVLAVDQAITHITNQTKRPVHIAGYSQGGMFAYQVAGYRKGEQIASIITFGSPVDLRRNMPLPLHDSLAAKVVSAARYALSGAIDEVKGIPGILNSYGFKLVSPKQEVKHLFKMLGLLHDKEALEQIMPKRRFLGGEGFIAWPGPALRTFVDEFIVNNRLLAGGFVINGKTASLAGLSTPILYILGEKDELARPASVRAIRRVVTHENVHEYAVRAGHFGLVVGSVAMGEVWPQVINWIQTHEDNQPWTEPTRSESSIHRGEPNQAQPLYDMATDLLDKAWDRLGEASVNATDVLHAMRWQLPRLARIMSLQDHTRISLANTLEEQAHAIPTRPFFFWLGEAYTYQEANQSVDQLTHQLLAQSIEKGQHVLLLMDAHPGSLLAVSALNRLGAIPVLIPPAPRTTTEYDAYHTHIAPLLEPFTISAVLTDPRHLDVATQLNHPLLALALPGMPDLPNDITTLQLTPSNTPREWPTSFTPNEGYAFETAMILYEPDDTGTLIPRNITNRRWCEAALVSAAQCTLTPADTVYCSVPTHQEEGILFAVGGALVGGSRLALRHTFSTEALERDTSQLGVTVCFYNPPIAHQLQHHQSTLQRSHQTLRLFAGNGMTDETQTHLRHAFPKCEVIELGDATHDELGLSSFL